MCDKQYYPRFYQIYFFNKASISPLDIFRKLRQRNDINRKRKLDIFKPKAKFSFEDKTIGQSSNLTMNYYNNKPKHQTPMNILFDRQMAHT